MFSDPNRFDACPSAWLTTTPVVYSLKGPTRNTTTVCIWLLFWYTRCPMATRPSSRRGGSYPHTVVACSRRGGHVASSCSHSCQCARYCSASSSLWAHPSSTFSSSRRAVTTMLRHKPPGYPTCPLRCEMTALTRSNSRVESDVLRL